MRFISPGLVHATLFVGAILFTLPSACVAAEKTMTAFEVLKEARRQLGNRSGKDVLSMESENGKLRPRYWWITFYDESLFLKKRVIQMIGPEMIQNIEPGNPFDGGNKKYVIDPESLKYDSDKCITFLERMAKDNGIPLHSINVRLEKPHPGETSPIWFFEFFNSKNEKLGKVSISASTGKVTEIIGLKIKEKRFAPVSKKTVSQTVGETFEDVGQGLEETFSGKKSDSKKDDGASAD
jgi:hypothetical protein